METQSAGFGPGPVRDACHAAVLQRTTAAEELPGESTRRPGETQTTAGEPQEPEPTEPPTRRVERGETDDPREVLGQQGRSLG